MRKLTKKNSIIITAVFFLMLVISLTLYWHFANAKYNNPDFKSYVKDRGYCDQFYGGTHENQAQLYEDWQQSHGMIGC